MGVEPTNYGFADRRPTDEHQDLYNVEPRGVEPRLPACKAGVLPLSLWPRKMANLRFAQRFPGYPCVFSTPETDLTPFLSLVPGARVELANYRF